MANRLTEITRFAATAASASLSFSRSNNKQKSKKQNDDVENSD